MNLNFIYFLNNLIELICKHQLIKYINQVFNFYIIKLCFLFLLLNLYLRFLIYLKPFDPFMPLFHKSALNLK